MCGESARQALGAGRIRQPWPGSAGRTRTALSRCTRGVQAHAYALDASTSLRSVPPSRPPRADNRVCRAQRPQSLSRAEHLGARAGGHVALRAASGVINRRARYDPAWLGPGLASVSGCRSQETSSASPPPRARRFSALKQPPPLSARAAATRTCQAGPRPSAP